MTTSIIDLLIMHDTDKQTFHDYGPIYEKYLAPKRSAADSILELGIRSGGSLKAWRDYFDLATVHGLDIDSTSFVALQNEPRIVCHLGSQNDSKILNEIGSYGPFDFIVDDASHEIHDQLYSLLYLWQYLKNDGLYVIEDLMEPAHLYTLRNLPNSVEFFPSKGSLGQAIVVIQKGK